MYYDVIKKVGSRQSPVGSHRQSYNAHCILPTADFIAPYAKAQLT